MTAEAQVGRVRVVVPPRLRLRPPAAGASVRILTGRSMGCAWRVTYLDQVDSRAQRSGEIEALLRAVVQEMSTWEQDSCISRYNHAARGTWTSIPLAFATVLDCALSIAHCSDGAFDPTTEALTRRWGFGPTARYDSAGFSLPLPQPTETRMQRDTWQSLQFEFGAQRIFQPGGLRLDLSAIAKGYAVDAVSQWLTARAVEHHLVEIGGECRGSGMKPNGQPWWVGLQAPADACAADTRIALHELAVATSGDAVQAYTVDGQRHSHCMDPRRGRPIDNGVAAVSVLHDSCMQADAWSTALMVLGPRDGLALAQRHSLAALWYVRGTDGMTEYSTPAFEAMLMEQS